MGSKPSVQPAKADHGNAILHVDFIRGIVRNVTRDAKKSVSDLTHLLSCDQQAIVQCQTFRCLAVAKENGKWLDLKGNALKDVRAVVYRF